MFQNQFWAISNRSLGTLGPWGGPGPTLGMGPLGACLGLPQGPLTGIPRWGNLYLSGVLDSFENDRNENLKFVHATMFGNFWLKSRLTFLGPLGFPGMPWDPLDLKTCLYQ